MAGLLDIFDTDEGRLGLGLLMAAGPRADGAGFGQRVGDAFSFVERGRLAREDALAKKTEREMRMAEMAAKQAEMARAAQLRDAAMQSYRTPEQAQAMSMGPGQSGAPIAQVAPGFDSAGFINRAFQIDPMQALQMRKAMAPEQQINKLDVKDFTPESVQRFAQTQNYGDLKRMDKLHFADTGAAVAGMNPFTGEAVSSTAKTGNPFSDLVLNGPDGWMTPNTPLVAAKQQIAKAGASSNNISVNTEKSFLNELAGGVGKQIDASLAGAKTAAGTMATLNRLDDVLNSKKLMVGPATAPRVLLTQIGTQLGLGGKDAEETLANTRQAMQSLAQLELDAAGQMKGQGQITEQERALLKRAAGGDINMTVPELRKLSEISRKTATTRIQLHNESVKPLLENKNAAPLAPFLTVGGQENTSPANVSKRWKLVNGQLVQE